MNVEMRTKRLQALFDSRSTAISPAGILAWLEAMGDLSDAEFESAVRGFTRESTEFLCPAAVRKFAGPRGMEDQPRAKLAWGEVRKAIRLYGGYQSVNFEDRIINAVVREMGGWNALCETTTEEMVWREKEFVALYGAVAKARVGDASSLPGISETTNAKLGHATDAPLLIESRLPEHIAAGALAVEERKPMPRLESSPSVRRVVEGFRNVDAAPETPALPSAALTVEEKQAMVEEQKRRMQEWMACEKTFALTCQEVA